MRLRCLLVILLTIALHGCDAAIDRIESTVLGGSTCHYANCLKRNSDHGLSDAFIEQACRQRLARAIRAEYSARGFYFSSQPPWTSDDFSLTVQNDSTSFVITGFTLLMQHSDNIDRLGQPIVEHKSNDTLWIEPGSYGDLDMAFAFFPRYDRRRAKLYDWEIIEIRGLRTCVQ